MFMTKKQRALMRKRKNKAKDGNSDAMNTANDDGSKSGGPVTKKRKVESNNEAKTISVVRIPDGISGSEARKFRKDARREARKTNPNMELKFVSHDNKKEEEETLENSKMKNKSRHKFPRINEILEKQKEEKKLEEKGKGKQGIEMSLEDRCRYIGMDCEMVGVGLSGKQSALARVSLVDYNGGVVLDTFVRVPQKVTDYRTFVSGVRKRDVNSPSAQDFFACRAEVGKILEGKILVGHALENDLAALMWTHPVEDIRDTAKYAPYMTMRNGKKRPRKLKDLAKEVLGIDIQREGEAHDSVQDANAAMGLYQKAQKEWEKLILIQNKKKQGKLRK